MRAVVQRASTARVVVSSEVVASFDGPGLVVLVGVTHDDTADRARRLAAKLHELRIFEPHHADVPPAHDRRELSAAELGLPVIVVSQFTLYGDTRKGNRPSYVAAAPPEHAEPLYGRFCDRLAAQRGVFGAIMAVELVNDGPVTLLVESRS